MPLTCLDSRLKSLVNMYKPERINTGNLISSMAVEYFIFTIAVASIQFAVRIAMIVKPQIPT